MFSFNILTYQNNIKKNFSSFCKFKLNLGNYNKPEMGTEVLKTYDNLQIELERAKSNLKGLNENIRRIIGRDLPDTSSRKRNFNDRRGNDYQNNSIDRGRGGDRQQRGDGANSPLLKKRPSQNDNPKSVFSRLSGPPARDEKPKLLSRVIRELPTRQEIVAAQGSDEQSRARNRRMFGCLLGTLQKFCQEESRLKPKEEKKAQIEKKLEEQEIQERENLKKERQNLFYDRKRQQQEIKILEYKMNRMKELGDWEDSRKPLKHFIRTKSKPHLYYIPKIMDKKTQQKLDDSRSVLEKSIEKKRQEVSDELQKIERRFHSKISKISDTASKVDMDHGIKDPATGGHADGDESDDHDDELSYSEDENPNNSHGGDHETNHHPKIKRENSEQYPQSVVQIHSEVRMKGASGSDRDSSNQHHNMITEFKSEENV